MLLNPYRFGVPGGGGSVSTYLAVGMNVSPYLTVLRVSDNGAETLSGGTPADLPYALSFKSDNSALAISSNATPYLKGLTPGSWANISAMTSGAGNGRAGHFSPAALNELAGGVFSSPYLIRYNASTWATKTAPASPPTALVRGVHYSPSGTFLAVVQQTSPSLIVYETSGFTRVTLGTAAPGGNGTCCAFSPDGSLLAVGTSTTFVVYETATWTNVTITGGGPAGPPNGLAWSPDGSKLAVAHSTTPCLTVYNVSGWSKRSAPAGMYTGAMTGLAVAFSANSSLMAFGHTGASFLEIVDVATWARIAAPTVAGSVYSLDYNKV